MPRLLVVHHTTAPALQAMDPAIEGATVAARPALAATAIAAGLALDSG
jgi:hypothetical protein